MDSKQQPSLVIRFWRGVLHSEVQAGCCSGMSTTHCLVEVMLVKSGKNNRHLLFSLPPICFKQAALWNEALAVSLQVLLSQFEYFPRQDGVHSESSSFSFSTEVDFFFSNSESLVWQSLSKCPFLKVASSSALHRAEQWLIKHPRSNALVNIMLQVGAMALPSSEVVLSQTRRRKQNEAAINGHFLIYSSIQPARVINLVRGSIGLT